MQQMMHIYEVHLNHIMTKRIKNAKKKDWIEIE